MTKLTRIKCSEKVDQYDPYIQIAKMIVLLLVLQEEVSSDLLLFKPIPLDKKCIKHFLCPILLGSIEAELAWPTVLPFPHHCSTTQLTRRQM